MDYIKQIKLIKTKLLDANLDEFASELSERQLSGGTGGEVLLIVCSYLLWLKHNEDNVYASVRYEADSLIEYAESIGLSPSY